MWSIISDPNVRLSASITAVSISTAKYKMLEITDIGTYIFCAESVSRYSGNVSCDTVKKLVSEKLEDRRGTLS